MDSTPLKLAPSTTPRRSLRRLSTCPDPKTPQSTPRCARKPKPKSGPANPPPPPPPPPSFSPVTPSTKEPKKRSRSVEPRVRVSEPPKEQKRVYYRKVVYDGGEFGIGTTSTSKGRKGRIRTTRIRKGRRLGGPRRRGCSRAICGPLGSKDYGKNPLGTTGRGVVGI